MNRITTYLLLISTVMVVGCVDERAPEDATPPESTEPIEPKPVQDVVGPEVTVTKDPEPTPKVEPEIIPDAMEWIQENWRARIRSVTITKEQSIPVFMDGQQVGEATLPIGQTIPIHKLDGETVTVHYLNNLHKVPSSDTDLKTRAENALSKALAASKRASEAALNPTIEPTNQRTGPPKETLRFVNDDLNLQFTENPAMEIRARIPPEPPEPSMQFEVRPGYTLIDSLDEFRVAIKKDGQKIRLKPGIYRAKKTDPPVMHTPRHQNPGENKVTEQDHIFNVSGSDNHFDLRGAVIETPVSVQSKLKRGGHVADTWHVNGANNTFEGGYFKNVVDMPYPDYFVTENEFEICNDGNTFLNCIFVIKGSIPFGYTDFYGKGAGGYGRLNKHSFMSFEHANNTSIIGCQIYQQSFGHALHFHKVDGVLIKDTLISGTLRPTNDIFKEKVGRAVEKDFEMVYRKEQPIPRDWMIPLTEDAVRSYNEVKNVVVIDTVVERQRGCFQLLCPGDITLENVAVIESGDFSYDLSSGTQGKTIMKNCFADVAYNPVFNLTRGDIPTDAFYEVTILSPRADVVPTERTSLGIICGNDSEFIFHDGTTTPIPEEYNKLICGGRKGMNGSTITNYTNATLILQKNVRDCRIKSVGPVIDNGHDNRVSKIRAPEKRIWTNPYN